MVLSFGAGTWCKPGKSKVLMPGVGAACALYPSLTPALHSWDGAVGPSGRTKTNLQGSEDPKDSWALSLTEAQGMAQHLLQLGEVKGSTPKSACYRLRAC